MEEEKMLGRIETFERYFNIFHCWSRDVIFGLAYLVVVAKGVAGLGGWGKNFQTCFRKLLLNRKPQLLCHLIGIELIE